MLLHAAALFAAAGYARVVAQSTPAPVEIPHARRRPPAFALVHYTFEYQHEAVTATGVDWYDGSGSTDQLTAQTEFFVRGKYQISNRFVAARLNSQFQFQLAPGKRVPGYWNHTYFEDELDYEFGQKKLVGAGIGYLYYQPIAVPGQRYNLRGLGAGIDKWPDFDRRFSFYGGAWYFPNMTPNDASDAYQIWQYDIGANLRANRESPYSMKLGFNDELWTSKLGGGNLRFSGPYMSLTYWK